MLGARVLTSVAVLLLLTVAAAADVVSGRVTVTTTATLIARSGSEVGPVLMKNMGPNPVYLGGSEVLTSTGYELAMNETLSITLGSGEAIYGIVASGTALLHKLENRK